MIRRKTVESQDKIFYQMKKMMTLKMRKIKKKRRKSFKMPKMK